MHEDTIAFLRKAFSDYFSFEEHMLPQVMRLLAHEQAGLLADKITLKLLLDVYGVCSAGKETAEQLKVVLSVTFILILHARGLHTHLLWTDAASVLVHYPSFNGVDQEELGYLLMFRNMLVLALQFIPAKGNKIFLLRVLERMEGSNNEYVTGSGQKPAVTRRVEMYETEGNVRAKRKAETVTVTGKKNCKLSVPLAYNPAPVLEQVVSVEVSVDQIHCQDYECGPPSIDRASTFDQAIRKIHVDTAQLTRDLDPVLQDFLAGTLPHEVIGSVELDDANLALLA